MDEQLIDIFCDVDDFCYAYLQSILLYDVERQLASLFSKNPKLSTSHSLAAGKSIPLQAFLIARKTTSSKFAYVDSTILEVCHVKSISKSRIQDLATTGKTTTGWFHA